MHNYIYNSSHLFYFLGEGLTFTFFTSLLTEFMYVNLILLPIPSF
jgi:hypothetical protein